MAPFEYFLLLAAVILGLALSDLAVSVHRLLSAGGRVRWDWLAPLAALVAFLKIITQWWGWFGSMRLAESLTFEMFIGVLCSAILLFLIAATALPDEFGEQPVDLRAHFSAVSRRYWLLFAAHFFVVNAVTLWANLAIERARFDLLQPGWLVFPAALALAFIGNRWWQTIGLAGFAALYVGQFLGQTLPR